MTWHDIIFIKISGIPNPENRWTWSFWSYCHVWRNFLGVNQDKRDKYNHQWWYNFSPDYIINQYFPILKKMINEITDTLFFDKSFLIRFNETNLNVYWNILITWSLYLWVLCFFSEGCAIYPTLNWWTISLLIVSHISFLLYVSMVIGLGVVLLFSLM